MFMRAGHVARGLRLRRQLRAQQGALPGAGAGRLDGSRAQVKLAGLEDIPGGAQIMLELTFEVEGGEKPACVAQTLARVYTGG